MSSLFLRCHENVVIIVVAINLKFFVSRVNLFDGQLFIQHHVCIVKLVYACSKNHGVASTPELATR